MSHIPIELFSTFSKITFDDPTHTYIHESMGKLTSVTTLIHKYTSEFDGEHWSYRKAMDYGLEQDQVKYAWEFLNQLSTYKGSALHNFIENHYLNKHYHYDVGAGIIDFGYDPIEGYYKMIKKQFLDFYSKSRGKLIPLIPEMIIYDEEFLISGMVDMLFYNVKRNSIQIYDWKTNKKLATSNRFQKMKGPLSHLDDCEFNTYSLQLNTYKYLIERNTGIKLDTSYIVWFFEGNKSFQLLEIPDMKREVELMINDFVK